jgi:hypothetical protein
MGKVRSVADLGLLFRLDRYEKHESPIFTLHDYPFRTIGACSRSIAKLSQQHIDARPNRVLIPDGRITPSVLFQLKIRVDPTESPFRGP